MVTKYNTGQIIYVPVRIGKAFEVQGRLLYTIKHRDYEFEDPVLETSLKEENGKVVLEFPRPLEMNIFFEKQH